MSQSFKRTNPFSKKFNFKLVITFLFPLFFCQIFLFSCQKINFSGSTFTQLYLPYNMKLLIHLPYDIKLLKYSQCSWRTEWFLFRHKKPDMWLRWLTKIFPFYWCMALSTYKETFSALYENCNVLSGSETYSPWIYLCQSSWISSTFF